MRCTKHELHQPHRVTTSHSTAAEDSQRTAQQGRQTARQSPPQRHQVGQKQPRPKPWLSVSRRDHAPSTGGGVKTKDPTTHLRSQRVVSPTTPSPKCGEMGVATTLMAYFNEFLKKSGICNTKYHFTHYNFLKKNGYKGRTGTCAFFCPTLELQEVPSLFVVHNHYTCSGPPRSRLSPEGEWLASSHAETWETSFLAHWSLVGIVARRPLDAWGWCVFCASCYPLPLPRPRLPRGFVGMAEDGDGDESFQVVVRFLSWVLPGRFHIAMHHEASFIPHLASHVFLASCCLLLLLVARAHISSSHQLWMFALTIHSH